MAATVSLNATQQQELDDQAQETFQTKRATVANLEEILYKPLPVLDHGFVRVVDYMGDDSAIVQSARVSYGKGTKKVTEDRGLINYLMRHWHTTPFEMCEIKFHIKLPIFVARQWIRHRTANVNEYSARYSILDKEFYLPKLEHLAAQSTINNQGRGEVLEGKYAQEVLELLKRDSMQTYDTYEYLLNSNGDESRPGLARELARMNLPVNYYTQWYWKIDLHNLMHFLRLRADAHAQYEIQAYADVMIDVLKRWVPFAYDAFMDYRVGAATFSSKMLSVLKRRLSGELVTKENSGLTAREWGEMEKTLEG
ncbi:MAG: FAD-dependent thymidylate synthase [Proteobacteria bacterium]|nr:FAD-dependent thymidylate synthase [Pseudomonadota bacterium]